MKSFCVRFAWILLGGVFGFALSQLQAANVSPGTEPCESAAGDSVQPSFDIGPDETAPSGSDKPHTGQMQSPEEPTILTQPLSVKLLAGTSHELVVQASGFGNLSYQWQVDTKCWEFAANGPVRYLPNMPPALGADGTLYWGPFSNKVYAIDGASGTKRWEQETDGQVGASPVVGRNGLVYIGCTDQKLYALDATTGRRRWEILAGNGTNPVPRSVPPVIGPQGIVYVASTGTNLYALAGNTGALLWKCPMISTPTSSPPAIGIDGTLYIARDSNIYALDGATGTERWKAPRDPRDCHLSVGADNTVFVAAWSGFYALDGFTGAARWRARIPYCSSSASVGPDGSVYVCAYCSVFCLDEMTGEFNWSTMVKSSGINSPPAIAADGKLYVASSGSLFYLDGSTGVLLNTNKVTGSQTDYPFACAVLGTNGMLYLVGSKGFVPVLNAVKVNAPLAQSAWPMFQQNSSLTGSLYPPTHPVITGQPKSTSLLVGTSGSLKVYALGQQPLTYQWKLNGADIPGATNPALRIDNVQKTQSGQYQVAVSNPQGQVVSQSAALDVPTWDELSPGTVGFTFQTGGEIRSSPAIDWEGLVYFGSSDGKVYAVDGVTGANRWVFTTGSPVVSSPAVGADGTVYVGSDRIYALDGTTGVPRWSFALQNKIESTPAIGMDGSIYFSAADGTIYALDGTTGFQRWALATTNGEAYSPVLGINQILYVECANGRLLALETTTGTTLWEYTAQALLKSSPAIGPGGIVYFTDTSRHVYAVDGVTGNLLWTTTVSGTVQGSPIIGPDNTIILATEQGVICGLNGATGTELWQFISGKSIRSTPALGSDQILYFVTEDGTLHALNTQIHTQQWQIACRSDTDACSSPAIGPNQVVYFCNTWGRLAAVKGSAPLAEGGWPMLQQNPRHTGCVPLSDQPLIVTSPVPSTLLMGSCRTLEVAATGLGPLTYQWQLNEHNLAGATNRSLVITNANSDQAGQYRVIVSNPNGRVISNPILVRVLSIEEWPTGGILWETILTTNAVTYADMCPALGGNGLLYFTPGDNRVYALDQATGTKRWDFSASNLIRPPPAVGTNGLVYAGSLDQKVYALDGETGVKRWEFATGNPVALCPAIGCESRVHVVSSNQLHTLSGDHGAKLWSFTLANSITSPPVIGADGTVYVGQRGGVSAVDGAQGVMRWTAGLDDRIDSMFLAIGGEGTVYAAGSALYALNPTTGEILWHQPLPRILNAAPVIGDNEVLVIPGGGDLLLAVQGHSGMTLWQTNLSGCYLGTSPVLASDGSLWIGCSDGRLWDFDVYTGAVRNAYSLNKWFASSLTLGTGEILFLGTAEGGGIRRACAVRSSAPVARAAWPMFQQNPCHTGQAPVPQPRIAAVQRTPGEATFAITTQAGKHYVLEYKNDLSETAWIPLSSSAGASNSLTFTLTFTDNTTTNKSQFYRVRME